MPGCWDSVIVSLRGGNGVVVSPFQSSGHIISTTLSLIISHSRSLAKLQSGVGKQWEDAMKSDQSSFLSLHPRGRDP